MVRAAFGSSGQAVEPPKQGVAHAPEELPPDFSIEERETWHAVRPYTMTSPERVISLVRAVQYLERYHIRGAFVECGVWRGGSMMVAARTLLRNGSADRDLFLFDTFSGMPAPAETDVDLYGRAGSAVLEEARRLEPEEQAEHHTLAQCPLEVVRANLLSTGYPDNKLHFVEGRVEDTIPERAPEQIALLRLDTDWYESTRHELTHLFPRLSRHGILVVDDYGYWRGARRAVDEYFERTGEIVFLNRVDFTGRIAVRP